MNCRVRNAFLLRTTKVINSHRGGSNSIYAKPANNHINKVGVVLLAFFGVMAGFIMNLLYRRVYLVDLALQTN
jgi:hypothetical protein